MRLVIRDKVSPTKFMASAFFSKRNVAVVIGNFSFNIYFDDNFKTKKITKFNHFDAISAGEIARKTYGDVYSIVAEKEVNIHDNK